MTGISSVGKDVQKGNPWALLVGMYSPKVPQLVSARAGLKLVCEFCLLIAVPSDLAHGEG